MHLLARHIPVCVLAAWLLAVGSAADASAQALTARDTAYVDSVFRAHSHPMALEGGRLTGPGSRFLDDATRDAQFVMIGESHYVAQIPQFTAALFGVLHRTRGFDHFAIEYGPHVGRQLSAPQVRGRLDSALAIARRYPHAFQFWNDEEIEALAAIGRISTARTDPIWGLDNEWGALHVLERLVEIAPDAASRRAAESLAARVRPIEGGRPFAMAQVERWISSADSAVIDSLRAAYSAAPGTEAASLIDILEFSNRVYTFNAAAGRGEPTGYRANAERERYMKEMFMERYRRAQAAGDSLPRVLLKFGSVHGGVGFTPTQVPSLGSFIHELAIANGKSSFHLVAWLVNEPGTYWSLTEEPPYALLGNVGSPASWTIVDFRPLRDLFWAGRMRALSPELRRAILSFDAALLIGSGTRGTYDALEGKQPGGP